MMPDEADLRAYVAKLEIENQRLNLDNWNLRNNLRDCNFLHEKFSKAFHDNQAMMLITRAVDGIVLDVNKVFEEVMGYTRDEILGKSVLELDLWLDREQRRELLVHLFQHGYVRNYESKGRLKSGEIIYWLCSVSIFEMHGEKYLLASLVDITERKQMEQTIRILQDKYSKAFNKNETIMAISRLADGVYLDINDSFEKTFGCSREEILGQPDKWFFWAEPGAREMLVEELSSQGEVRNKEYRYKKKNGEIGFLIGSASYVDIDRERCVITSWTDITERKKTEAELEAAKDKFYKVFNDNQSLMAIVNVDEGRFIDVNNTALETFGYNREEIVGFTFLDKGLWADLYEREYIIGRLQQKGYLDNIECTLHQKEGHPITLMCSVNLMMIDNVNCVIVSGTDITTRKKADEALKQSEQLLALIINSLPFAVIIRTVNEKAIVAINDTFLARHDLAKEDVIGRTIEGLGFVKDQVKMEEFFTNVLEYGLMKNLEIEILSPQGKTFTTLLSGVLIMWQGTPCFLTISNDITNLREYEKELARLDNLNLMGQMAASIAHEVRNPMTSIKGFLQLFETEAKYSDDIEALELMIEELDRVNSIITSFLSLAQKNIINVRLHNLNDIIKNLQPLIMADAIKNDISLKVELGDVQQVMVDEGEIRQILLNLSQNAMQAMPGGGRLNIRTFAEDGGVNLAVEDSGQGIPPEVMSKVGTPFITTKKEGTGIGLALCYSIAERLGAKITIDTSDDGTSFTVTFPLTC